MNEHFNLELLQAISDWQQGGGGKLKHERGQKLKSICEQSLDKKYRTCERVAFRRVALHKSPLWKLMSEKKLPETISSWSVDLSFVKEFKDGVPKSGWQGIILQHQPNSTSAIINLSTLFGNAAFQSAIERYRHEINGFEYGIGKYGNLQSEVVIECESVSPNDIYALGGYSSTPDDIGRIAYGRDVTDAEIASMRSLLQKHGEDFGAWWIEGQPKDRVIEKIAQQIPMLLEIKKANKKKTKKH